jgi:hypothetical protein
MKIRLLFFQLIIPAILVNISCNAPRNNPLDPLNSNYNYGTIEGVIQTIGTHSGGIPGVRVIWENANLIDVTDANGRFRLNSIPIKDGNIIFSKTGYKPDTLNVVWGSTKRYFVQVFFNRIPVLDSLFIYTVITNEILTTQTKSELFVKAWITDLDDDVDTVFVSNELLNLKKPLTYSAPDGVYQTSINEDELNVDDIEETIGQDFQIIAKDKFLNEFVIGNDRVTRVIKGQVSGRHPSTDSSIIVTAQPVIFKWNEFDTGYNFTYLIEVYENIFPNSQLIHTKTDIPADSTSYTLTQDLALGNYSWVIWVIDQFQNRSRSIPVNFRITSSTALNKW